MSSASHDPRSFVHALHALGETGDSDLQEIVDLVASICEVESAAVAIVEEEYHLVVTHGVERLVCSREESLCQHTMGIAGSVVIDDVLRDDRFLTSPFVDGTKKRVRFYASAPIYAPTGEMVGRLCIFDNSPRQLSALQRRALETLASNVTGVLELRLRRQLDSQPVGVQAEDEMVRIAAEISHDMRVPLASILANLEMLRTHFPREVSPAARSMLVSAERAASRLVDMTNGLLDFHTAGHGVSSTVDLQSVVRQVLDELSIDDAAVSIGDLPKVHGEPTGLYSVLLNLIANSVKFARPDVALKLSVDSRRIGDRWRISVVDNGIGVPARHIPTVFEMFSRVDNRVQGHGIGLATVRRIIRAHGGDVGLISPIDGTNPHAATGTGTEVWFDLPADPTP